MKSNDLMGYCSEPAKSFTLNYLGPIQTKPKLRIWQHYLQHTPSPRGRGCLEQRSHIQTNGNNHHHGSRKSLLDGYTSYEFVSDKHMCALQRICKHPPLFKGDSLRSPRLESTISLNPHFDRILT